MTAREDNELPADYIRWKRRFLTPSQRYSTVVGVLTAALASAVWIDAASGPHPVPQFDVSAEWPELIAWAALVNDNLSIIFILYWFLAAYLVLRIPGESIWLPTMAAILMLLPSFALNWPDGRAGGYETTNLFLSGIWMPLLIARGLFQVVRVSILNRFLEAKRFWEQHDAAATDLQCDDLNAAAESHFIVHLMDQLAESAEQALNESRWAPLLR